MYTAFYNLREEPFRQTPDPRFLHLAEPHRIALKALLEGILLRKGFLVMSGPVGTGKTTMLHAVLQMLSEKSFGTKRLATAFLVNPTLSRDELLETVLDEFEITCGSSSKPRRLAALHEMLLETQRRGATAVLFLDEAHLLTPELLEEVRLLSNADTYQEKLLQIVLCGQPELSTLLEQPNLRALRQRIAAICQLRPLSLPETRGYVTERLYAAGLRGPSPFAGSALETAYRSTGGVPRLINMVCDVSLSLGFAARKSQIESDVVEDAAASLGLNTSESSLNEPKPAASAQADINDSQFGPDTTREERANSLAEPASSSTARSEVAAAVRPSAPEPRASSFGPSILEKDEGMAVRVSLSSSVRGAAAVALRPDGNRSRSAATVTNGSTEVRSSSAFTARSSTSPKYAGASVQVRSGRSRSTLEILGDALRQGRASAQE